MNTAIDRVLRAPGFAVGEHLLAQSISRTPAGKGINISRALARLGRSNVATGFAGHEEADQFEALLRGGEGFARVNDQLLSVHGPTRENITIVDPDAATDTHLRTQGYELSQHDMARLSAKVGLLSRDGAVFVFAGSLPAGMDDAALTGLVSKAQDGGALVVLDLDGKTLGNVMRSLNRPVWMVSPNRAELAQAVGRDGEMNRDDLLDAARGLTSKAGWVLVSLGAKGGMLITESGAWHGLCEVDPSRIVSTVGGGDCLIAAVLDARLNGAEPAEALARGLAVATASTLQPSPSDFDMQCVHELEQAARIEQL